MNSLGASDHHQVSVAVLRRRETIVYRFVRVLNRDKYLYLIFALPFLYFLIFHYVPMYGIVLAFKDFDVSKGILDSPWVGLKHFQEFFSNPYSYKLIWNTVILRLWHLCFGFPMPIILALLLNELTHEKFKRLVQSSTYLPHFISLVVVCGMIVSFLSTDGIVNNIVRFFGGKPFPWIMAPEWFRPIYILSGIWQEAGWTSVIYLAALTAINLELYEAAAIDGANRLQRLIHITVPGILPTIMVMLLLRIGQFLAMDYQKVLLLYTGATYETADILGTYIYRRGILGADFSFATAVGLFQSLVGLIFITITNWISKRTTETSLW
jgi:putative aldouronate transport system permease protein